MDGILKHRVTSLERWGHREQTPYTLDQLKKIKASSYNAIFVNGGSGMGPDAISPEMFIKSDVIPDLMPQAISENEIIVRQRIEMTTKSQLENWLMWWGIPGPDQSHGTANSVNTNYLDKHLKYEMQDLLKKEPELFGYRNPQSCNWRGSRPLCLSNDKVKKYYKDITKHLCTDFSQISGIVFFPGDHNLDMCDDSCKRCSKYYSKWQVYVEHLNDISEIIGSYQPEMKLYVILWHPTNQANHWIFENLSSRFGVIITLNDIVYQSRRPHIEEPFLSSPVEVIEGASPRKEMIFNQPWMNISQIGEIANNNFQLAKKFGRDVLALHEFSQSEVYDPVINFSLPGKTIEALKNLNNIGFSGFMDFWGNYGPVEYHCNHLAMKCFFKEPEKGVDELLLDTAREITGIENCKCDFNDQLVNIWKQIENAVDNQAYFSWFQRLNPAIGRIGARGHFYKPFIPGFLCLDNRDASLFVQCTKSWLEADLLDRFARSQDDDVLRFAELSRMSELLSKDFRENNNQRAFEFMFRQSLSLKLYGSLLGSMSRMLLAINSYYKRDLEQLRKCIFDEIDSRLEHISITKKIGYGINIDIVEEDIKLMCQFVDSKDFPDTPVDSFKITQTIYCN